MDQLFQQYWFLGEKVFSEHLPCSLSRHQSTGSALLFVKRGSGSRGLLPEPEGNQAVSNTPGTPPAESHSVSESLYLAISPTQGQKSGLLKHELLSPSLNASLIFSWGIIYPADGVADPGEAKRISSTDEAIGAHLPSIG